MKVSHINLQHRIITIRCICGLIASFFVVEYYDKLSLRRGMCIATLINALSSIVFSVGGNVRVYYIGAALAGFGCSLGAIIPMTVLISNWFYERRGFAMGVCSMGTGIASIVFSPLITHLVLNKGLRTAYLVQAAFMAVCALLIFLLVRDRPEDMGLRPYGQAPEHGSETIMSNDSVKITAFYWALFAVMMLLHGSSGTAGIGHVSIIASTSGYTALQVGAFSTLFGVAQLLGKILLGMVADRIGTIKATAIFVFLFFLGCLSSLGMDGASIFFPYAFVALLGLGNAIFVVGFPLWAQELSSKNSYKKTLRVFQILFNAGGILFSSVPGRIADRTGEYQSSYIIMLLFELVVMIILIVGYKARKNGYNAGGMNE